MSENQMKPNPAASTPPPPPSGGPATSKEVATKTTSSAVVKKSPDQLASVVNETISAITDLVEMKMIVIPENYSIQNALKAASLLIQAAVNKEGKPALEVCTPVSVANALYRMGVQALNPLKRQCSFVVMGDQLVCMTEYAGQVAMAKRYGMKSIVSNVIYEKDTFEMEIDVETGLKKLVKHQHSYENIDMNAIKGAYAIVTMEDGTKFIDAMTKFQIEKAWQMGSAKGNSDAHKNFPDMMMKKTIESRMSKAIVNKSDDAALMGLDDTIEDAPKLEIPKTNRALSDIKTIDTQQTNDIEHEDVVEEQPKEAPAPPAPVEKKPSFQ